MPYELNLDPHYKGDTFKGKSFTITINDSPAVIKSARMDLRKNPAMPSRAKRFSTEDGSLTIEDNVVTIVTQIIDIPAVEYFYDLEITYTYSGADYTETIFKGKFPITQEVTYG